MAWWCIPLPLSLNRGITVEAFHAEFCAAAERGRKLTDRERLAFVLFNSSFFQPGADARFLLLTMAIEALIEPTQKSFEAIQLVDGFIKQTKESAVQRSERDSLIGSLKWLRYESISKAGQRFAKEKLGDKCYEGRSAPDYFADIYSIRSSLVHGKVPFPSFDEINALAAAWRCLSLTYWPQMNFKERTRDDRRRHPVFLGLREEKNASDVNHEKAS
jgi:hypothetical protein